MNTPTTQTIELSEEIERYLRERLEIEVNEKIPAIVTREEDRRFSQLKWLVALVSVVGLGTFGTLSNYLIEKAVDSRLEIKTGNMTDALDFIRFSSLSQKLESGNSFSRQDRTAIMSYLRKFAKNERIRFSPDFLAALTQVLESFLQADQSSSIDEVLQLYEKELLNSDAIVEILLHHYGQRITTRTGIPKEDSLMSIFEKLESISTGAKLPELALAYRIMFTHRSAGIQARDATIGLLRRVTFLDESDRVRLFQEILTRTKAENWQTRVGDSGRIFEHVTKTLLREHSEAIALMAGVDDLWVKKLAETGVDSGIVRSTAQKLATRSAPQ